MPGDIALNGWTCLSYDGTNFDLMNPVGHTGSGNMVLATSPSFSGNPAAPTQTAGDNSTKIATTAYVDSKSIFTEIYTAGTTGTTAEPARGKWLRRSGHGGHWCNWHHRRGPIDSNLHEPSGSGRVWADSCVADNAITSGDLLGAGTTTAGRCKDLGRPRTVV